MKSNSKIAGSLIELVTIEAISGSEWIELITEILLPEAKLGPITSDIPPVARTNPLFKPIFVVIPFANEPI